MCRRLSMATILWLALLAGCGQAPQDAGAAGPVGGNGNSSADAESAGRNNDSGTSTETTADQPVIVAGTYLTCTPLTNPAAGDNEVDVGCRVDGMPQMTSYLDLKNIRWNMKLIGKLDDGLTAELYDHPNGRVYWDGVYVFKNVKAGETARTRLQSSPAGFEAASSDGHHFVIKVNPTDSPLQASTINRALNAGYAREANVSIAASVPPTATPIPAPFDLNALGGLLTNAFQGGQGGGGGSGNALGQAAGGQQGLILDNSGSGIDGGGAPNFVTVPAGLDTTATTVTDPGLESATFSPTDVGSTFDGQGAGAQADAGPAATSQVAQVASVDASTPAVMDAGTASSAMSPMSVTSMIGDASGGGLGAAAAAAAGSGAGGPASAAGATGGDGSGGDLSGGDSSGGGDLALVGGTKSGAGRGRPAEPWFCGLASVAASCHR